MRSRKKQLNKQDIEWKSKRICLVAIQGRFLDHRGIIMKVMRKKYTAMEMEKDI